MAECDLFQEQKLTKCIAFDGDAVLFVSESERIYQHEGIQAFMDNERAKADIPLQKGPFAIFF